LDSFLARLRIPLLAPIRERLRLIPAVMVLGFVLLALKGAGLAVEAEAQEQPAATAAATAPSAATAEAPQQASDDADDETQSSSAQVDVLTSLAKRRAELDGRERDLAMRENLIAAAEKRVDGKIDSLRQLQASIQALLVQRDQAEQKQLDALVKTYSNMRPKDAARIFDSLDENVAISVAAQLKPDVLAPILGAMNSEAAQKLTVKLAGRLKVSEQQQQAAAQLASVSPPPAAPSAAASAPAVSQQTSPASPGANPSTPAPTQSK
jgi:flagellar motility protein MotE (MotC chaperone)